MGENLLEFDDLDFVVAETSEPATVVVERPRRDFMKWLLIGSMVAMVAWQLRGCIPSPGPDPIPIPTDSPAVLFALDGDTGLTIDQAQVAISQKVQTYADANEIDYRRYDVADDLSREDEFWQTMMEAARRKPPAMVTVDANGTGVIHDIPASVEDAIRTLERLK